MESVADKSPSTEAPNIETSVNEAIDAGKIHGAIICATDANGHFVYNKTFGERTLLSGEKKPLELDDVCFVASGTKLMAAIAALTCVEDGLLTLTGDVSSFAPELAAKQVLTGFSEDGEPLLEPQNKPITLEMLLTHSAGVAYHFIDPVLMKYREKRPPKREEGQKFKVEELFTDPLVFQPGSAWTYGPGLDWAGRIVERVTGKTLCERLNERVFGPLGLNSAEFCPVTREDLRERMIDLNPEDPEGLGRAVSGGHGDTNKELGGDFGGHGLFIPASDYTKVLHSLLANDGKILKPETVDNMLEHHLSPEATEAHQAAIKGPMGRFFLLGTSPESKAGYGIGGHLTLEDVDGWYGERTLTWGGGLTFAWFMDRKNDLCGVGAFQAALPIDMGVIEALKQTFRKDVYRKRAEWKKERSS